MRYRVGILFKGHDLTSAWWWESVIFARKFLLATFVVAFCDSTRMGGYFIVWLLEASFVLHLVANPYANERKHRLESYGLLASIITFNCGILYREDYGDYVNTAVTLVLFATHIGMSLLLGKSMYEEFAAEGRNALIARAQHDIMLEEKIANEFEKRKASRAEMEREEENRRNSTHDRRASPLPTTPCCSRSRQEPPWRLKPSTKGCPRGSRDCARRGGNGGRRTRRRSIGWTKRTWQGSSPLWSAGANAVPRNRASQLRRETKTKASGCREERMAEREREKARQERKRDDSFLES